MSDTSGIVDIRGKSYQTVALRVKQFRGAHPDWSITTAIHEQTDERVTVIATIGNEEGRTLATGHAEEYRGASAINRTSAVENCETSAVGRALAFLGYAGDGSLASAEELRPKAPAPEEVPATGNYDDLYPMHPLPDPDAPPASSHAEDKAAVGDLLRSMGAGRGSAAKRLIATASEGVLSLADVDSRPGEVLAELREYERHGAPRGLGGEA